MADKLYKTEIDAPTTVNTVQSLLLPLDKDKGSSFRITRAWAQVPDLDAIAATDQVGIQFVQDLNRGGEAALLNIDSEYEIYTKVFDFHLGEAALTGLEDPSAEIELPSIEGTFLDVSKRNYATALITGQDGAIPVKLKILGGYTKAQKDDFNFNKF